MQLIAAVQHGYPVSRHPRISPSCPSASGPAVKVVSVVLCAVRWPSFPHILWNRPVELHRSSLELRGAPAFGDEASSIDTITSSPSSRSSGSNGVSTPSEYRAFTVAIMSPTSVKFFPCLRHRGLHDAMLSRPIIPPRSRSEYARRSRRPPCIRRPTLARYDHESSRLRRRRRPPRAP